MHCPHNRPRGNCQLLRSRYNLEEYLDGACLRGDMVLHRIPQAVLLNPGKLPSELSGLVNCHRNAVEGGGDLLIAVLPLTRRN
jgi:hypothetical protein